MGEVAVLQGTPLMGLAFALHEGAQPSWPVLLHTLAVLVCASSFLVAHVFVLNDWAGIDADLRDPHRKSLSFLALGVNRESMLGLAFLLGLLGLALSGFLGLAATVVASGLLLTSVLYSAPPLHGKGVPVANSLLHLVGGSLHFLLGYLALAEWSLQSTVLAAYFGLVFAAGHLMHEVRGHEADGVNGIRTNSVVFGKKATYATSFALFSVAYVLIACWGALERHLWVVLVAVSAYLLHGVRTWQALRSRLNHQALLKLQRCYRGSFALIGLILLFLSAQAYYRSMAPG